MTSYTIIKDKIAYTVEVTALDAQRIIDTILRQVTEAIEGTEITQDCRNMLSMTKSAIEAGNINTENVEDYLRIWYPQPMYSGQDCGMYSLTLYRDDKLSFLCFIPSSTILYNVYMG